MSLASLSQKTAFVVPHMHVKRTIYQRLIPQPWLTIFNSHTAPGGYFEFHDYDAVLKSATGTPLTPENSDLARWWSFVIDTASKSGRSFQIATSMKERVEKAG